MQWGLFVGLVLFGPGMAAASKEAEFEAKAAKLEAVEVVSKAQLDQALHALPGQPLQIPGTIQGMMGAADSRQVMLKLVDGEVIIESRMNWAELQQSARVRCLVVPMGRTVHARLELVDITWDKTPPEVLREAARASLKFPVKSKEEIARAAVALQRNQQAVQPTPTRGGDRELVIKRAIAHFNPRLSKAEVDTIANSILSYSARYGVDPYMVVAVVAAESRFNPNARSYKGAAGLGQLMPATAEAHGVDPYDPVANLEVAIRIISRNLKKYHNDWNLALAAYNAGTGAVSRYGGVPPYRETRTYLWRIYEYWCWLNGTAPEPRPK